jgi:hypothetical protein
VFLNPLAFLGGKGGRGVLHAIGDYSHVLSYVSVLVDGSIPSGYHAIITSVHVVFHLPQAELPN